MIRLMTERRNQFDTAIKREPRRCPGCLLCAGL